MGEKADRKEKAEMYFRVCPHCGCALDPSERCDCQQERRSKQEQEERKHIEALDRKIERLQEKVIKKHKEYSVLAEELSTLLDERHPERKIERAKQALYDAYVESERSLDKIIDLIRNADEWI